MSKIILNIIVAIIAVRFFLTADFHNLGVLDIILLVVLAVWAWTLVDRIVSYIRK